MILLLLVLILPLSEEDNRLPKHVAKPEWTATISDDTSNIGCFARPPPASVLCEIRVCQALQNTFPEAWESIVTHIYCTP